MPTKNRTRIEEIEGRAGVERSEPGGRAGVLGTDVEIGGVSPVLEP
jgi:hypothetical protein